MDVLRLQLPDARTLTWSEAGDPDGFPVVALHGTPGSRHQVLLVTEPLAAARVRCIAVDRPGYGGSTFQPGRRLVDFPGDVLQLADHLGLDRFGVIGVSGGGPHAAVCARFLPERVAATAIVSGVGPLSSPGSEAGMMPINRCFAKVARRAPWVNRVPFGAMGVASRRFPDRLLATMAKGAPAPDAAVFARPAIRDAFRAELAQTAKTSGRAAAQDFELFAHDWGFRLEDITVPVDVWQGDADVNVPVAHAHHQADAIPGATLHLIEGEGHFMFVDHLGEILQTLLNAARA